MATQHILFSETIAGMKKAFKRKAYESDSDSEIEKYSNRGNKLKKRARFSHQGQLVPNNGPSAYTEYVDYAGYRRPIIHRNPPLIDDEGYAVDSDDDEDRLQHAALAAAKSNPYANIHLEHILAPLTASTALSTHATLSKPFTSKNLTKLVDQGCDIMRKENRSLWRVRHLLTDLCGDFTWVPCSMMVQPTDIELYTDDHVARHLLSLSKGSVGETPSPATLNGDVQHQNGVLTGDENAKTTGKPQTLQKPGDPDLPMVDADTVNKDDAHIKEKANGVNTSSGKKQDDSGPVRSVPTKSVDTNSVGITIEVNTDEGDKAAESLTHHPGTERKSLHQSINDLFGTNGGQTPSLSSEVLDHFVHPMFIAPVGAKPDRDVGIPEQEAEDIRRLLALYVQKQEEVCRGAKKLFLGLLKAEKLRKDVLHWSKAEAHTGVNRDMSDGEDWYDKEEWGLTEDLKKGQDEEEEDTQTTGKKTRNRR